MGEVAIHQGPNHPSNYGHGKAAGEGVGVGVSKDDGEGIIGQFKEVEVEPSLIQVPVFSDADVELGAPMGLLKVGEGHIGFLEGFVVLHQSIIAGAFFFNSCRFVVAGEVGDKVDDVFIPLFFGDGDRFGNDLLQARRQERDVDESIAQFPQNQFIGDDSQRVDVRRKGGIGGVLFLFGAHVARRADHFVEEAGPLLFVELGDAEIDDLHFPIFGDEDVFWLEVPMDDAVSV